MCCNIEKANLTEYTGYKVVITDKYGHHYSPYTGVRYKKGPVPKLPKVAGKYIISDFSDYNPLHGYYYNKMQAKNRLTAVFNNYSTAVRLLELKRLNMYQSQSNYKLNIVEMKISGNLYEGLYFHGAVTLSDKIESIKIMKMS
jgi:hypothetical protein